MSLLKMNAEEAIATLVETALERGSGKDGRGLHIRLDCRMSNYNCYREVGTGKLVECDSGDGPSEEVREQVDEWPIEASLNLHMLFFRPTNYTQVYSCITDSWDIPDPDEWVLQSDHDSCWRTDGMHDMPIVAMKLHKAVAREGIDNFRDLSEHCWPHPTRVTIEVKKGPEQFGPKRWEVVKVERGWPDGTEARPM